MHILLVILLIIAIIIALLLIAALFTKKGYAIERSITINRPVAEVFDYIKHVKNQDHYNKWAMMDPNMKKEYKGTDGAVGFVYKWDGNKKAGAGEQEIKGIREGELVDIEIRFVRPFAGVSKTPLTTTAITPQQTRVSWGISSQMKYPMNIMLAIINIEKLLGKDIEESLGMLKANLEK